MTTDTTPHEDLTDADLVAACLRGAELAWDEFVRRFARLIYAASRRRGLSDADAEEVLQTTFEAAWQNLDQLRDPAAIRGWLLTTAMRECWRVGRAASAAPGSVDTIAEPQCDDPDQLHAWERQDVVRRGLDLLGEPCRELLVAIFNRGSDERYADIAARLEIPVGSIGPTRGRCFRKLEDILTQLGFQP